MKENKNIIIEKCAQRIETYNFSLEINSHIGIPDAFYALQEAAKKVRELQKRDINLPPLIEIHKCPKTTETSSKMHFVVSPPEGKPFHFLLIEGEKVKCNFCPECGCPV